MKDRAKKILKSKLLNVILIIINLVNISVLISNYIILVILYFKSLDSNLINNIRVTGLSTIVSVVILIMQMSALKKEKSKDE